MKKKKPNPVGRKIRPKTKKQLHEYIYTYLNLYIPENPVCLEHSSALDYLWYAYNSDYNTDYLLNADAVVWANRGGGKTKIAAVATLLNCIFKTNCSCRILSGSGDQAGRMYDYLIEFVRCGFEHLVAGRISKTICSFTNGSNVEVLKQSQASVRGHHVQKLRCDEVELFDKNVYKAANLSTKSGDNILSAFESLSTMNTSYGMMRKIVKQAEKIKTPVFKWCIWDVIEKCKGRDCNHCTLYIDCQGISKKSNGYYKIDDVISTFQRIDRKTWVYEMLCSPDDKNKGSYGIVKERRY